MRTRRTRTEGDGFLPQPGETTALRDIDVVTALFESVIHLAKIARGNATMADYKHGSMNIDVQEKTFAGFIKASTYVAAASIGALIFIALVNG